MSELDHQHSDRSDMRGADSEWARVNRGLEKAQELRETTQELRKQEESKHESCHKSSEQCENKEEKHVEFSEKSPDIIDN